MRPTGAGAFLVVACMLIGLMTHGHKSRGGMISVLYAGSLGGPQCDSRALPEVQTRRAPSDARGAGWATPARGEIFDGSGFEAINWNMRIADAERVIGSPVSRLRPLLSDEVPAHELQRPHGDVDEVSSARRLT